MANRAKKLEVTANIAIIVAAIALTGFLIMSYIGRDRGIPFVGNQLHAGTKLNLKGVDWSKNNLTLVMVLSTTCHFCSESAPFYQRLERGRSNMHLLVVLPQGVAESQKYLTDLGLKVDDIRQAQLTSVGVNGTPTLILVNNSGVVTNVWAGKLTTEEENQVLNEIAIN